MSQMCHRAEDFNRYCLAQNIIPSLKGEKLSDDQVVQKLFQNLERSCLPRELKPQACNITLSVPESESPF